MGSLQLALLVLGVLVVAAVVAHGAWQARRAGVRRASPRREAAPQRFEEPVLRFEDFEPPLADALEPALAPAPARRPLGPRLDPLIDAIVPLVVELRFTGESVMNHLPATRRAGSKPFFIEGLNDATSEWEPPQAGQTYREFQAGVQLANRTGALNEIEYSEFVQKVQAFADAIGATAEFPDMLDVVARARELDQFASQHDAQLACRLVARGAAWSVAYIQQHAARHGFVSGAVPGRLVLPGSQEGAPAMLTLQFDAQAAFAEDPSRAAVRDVSLAFDVPQTSAGEAPFQAWQASAQALALGMEAAVVDDAGQPLSPQAFAAIGRELEQLYATLEARGLPAGSAAARRLFS
ncbi:MAG: cell division protein FtsZ [Caldimonas sp.]|uniref:cell division protein FtsZ n=1 Tax=Caldimonas sp. TaxID=2838790 RepID=UPI003919B8C4